MHACDRQTDRRMDRITTPNTALAYARAVKMLAFPATRPTMPLETETRNIETETRAFETETKTETITIWSRDVSRPRPVSRL